MNFNSGGRVVAGSNPVIPTKLSAKPSIERSEALLFSRSPCLHKAKRGNNKDSLVNGRCANLCNLPKGIIRKGVKRSRLRLRSSQSSHPDKVERKAFDRKIGGFVVFSLAVLAQGEAGKQQRFACEWCFAQQPSCGGGC